MPGVVEKGRLSQLLQIWGGLVDPRGQPAAGVGLAIEETPSQPVGAREPAAKRVLATAVSDHNGLYVLTVPRPENGNNFALSVSTLQDSLPFVKDLAQFPEWTEGKALSGPHMLIVPAPDSAPGVTSRPSLRANSSELAAAFASAPQLFGRLQSASAPDPCSPLPPGSIPARIFKLNQLYVFPGQLPAPGAGIGPMVRVRPEETKPSSPQLGQPLQYGLIFNYTQEWWDVGFTLGDLLYSVPLAPGEETKIATVDWRRTEYATKSTSLSEEYAQDSTVTRNQNIDEVVSLASQKNLNSSTDGWGVSGSLGPATGGYAQEATNVTEAVTGLTNATQSLNDVINQTTNAVRNTRSFAIVETTQQEDVTVNSRVLRNHNHCHTVTFQYYEVVQHYLLSTTADSVQPAVFVSFTPLTFTASTLLAYGDLIRRSLLDPSLGPVLDAFLGLSPAPAPPPGTSPPTGPATSSQSAASGSVIGFEVAGHPIYPGSIGAAITQGWPGNQALLLVNDAVQVGLGPGGTQGGSGIYENVLTSTQLASPMPLESISRAALMTGGQDVNVDGLRILAVLDDGTNQELLFMQTASIPKDRWLVADIGPAAPPAGLAAPLDLARLLAHLNAHAIYYTGQIIAGEDAATRYAALSMIPYDTQHSVAQVVQNIVAGIIGAFVGFPLTSISYLPAQFQPPAGDPWPDPGTLISPDQQVITLPTPGIFAESQLGKCCACEKIDPTRFWDWIKSPIPEEAPDITAAMLASRAQNLGNLLNVPAGTLTPAPVQIPQEPAPMIRIGDATLSKLVSDLNITDAKDALSFLQGLMSASAQASAQTIQAQQGSPGMTSLLGSLGGAGDAAGAGAAGGAGDAGAADALLPLATAFA
jgi:hypothetical protein